MNKIPKRRIQLILATVITLLASVFFMEKLMAKNELLEDMDILYTSPGHEGSDVSPAVQKYFPIGTPVKIALKQLQEMGFDIDENHYDRSRTWPDGKWHYAGSNPNADPITIRNIQRSFKNKTDIHYLAEKKVGRWRMIVYKKYLIAFSVNDGKVLEIEGFIYLYGL